MLNLSCSYQQSFDVLPPPEGGQNTVTSTQFQAPVPHWRFSAHPIATLTKYHTNPVNGTTPSACSQVAAAVTARLCSHWRARATDQSCCAVSSSWCAWTGCARQAPRPALTSPRHVRLLRPGCAPCCQRPLLTLCGWCGDWPCRHWTCVSRPLSPGTEAQCASVTAGVCWHPETRGPGVPPAASWRATQTACAGTRRCHR
mmetsp:Transcript_16709/g.41788  ORF Transcript_16709/g.41788 Transcript_16709/m.41788 type:complete len:200 (-) Transcript_16709:772-1371(-)